MKQDIFEFMPEEYKGLQWKQATYNYEDINGWMVSENGFFYRPGNGEVRVGHDNVRGKDRHLRISLNNKNYYVARIVAEAFVPNDNPKVNKIVRHLNDNPHNNHYTNLKWGTSSENTHDGIVNECIVYDEHRKYTRCENHPGAILTNQDVIKICERLKTGEHINKIAEDYHIGRSNVWHIYSGSSWRPITKKYLPFPETCITTPQLSDKLKYRITRVIIRKPNIMPSEVIRMFNINDSDAVRALIGSVKRELKKSLCGSTTRES